MTSIQKPRIKQSIKQRIQKSLRTLKELVHVNTQINEIDNSDILELAVNYIRKTHQSSFGEQFLRGYINATKEVSFAISHLPQINEVTADQIINRLENQITSIFYLLICH